MKFYSDAPITMILIFNEISKFRKWKMWETPKTKSQMPTNSLNKNTEKKKIWRFNYDVLQNLIDKGLYF